MSLRAACLCLVLGVSASPARSASPANASCLVHDESNDPPSSLLQKSMRTDLGLPSPQTWQARPQMQGAILVRNGSLGPAKLQSVPVEGHDSQRQQRVAPETLLPVNQFGFSVCISGTWAVVGAPCDATCAGSAYFYRLGEDKKWTLVQTVAARDSANGDGFGSVCSIDGRTAVFGPAYSVFGNGTGGDVHIFSRKAGEWREVQKINAAVTGFGTTVSISGSRLIVGAPVAGAVYIYSETPSKEWLQDACVMAPPGSPPSFGFWVSISGRIAIVGAFDTQKYTTGAAYILEQSKKQWVTTKLDFSPTGPTEFGWFVAVGGHTAVVGDGLADNKVGAAYVYERQGLGKWQPTQKLVPPHGQPNDQFSWLGGISGNSMIISSISGISGYAVVFKRRAPGQPWIAQEPPLRPNPSFPGDSFGIWASISGPTAAVSSLPPPPQKGAAYFFNIGEEEQEQ